MSANGGRSVSVEWGERESGLEPDTEYTPDLEPFTEGRKTLKRFGLKSGSTVSSLGCRLFMNCNVNVDCRLHQQHYREERGNSERVAESVGY